MPDLPRYETHVVENQPPEFAPRDLWADDVVLRDSVRREGAGAFAGRGGIAAPRTFASSRAACSVTPGRRRPISVTVAFPLEGSNGR